MASMCCCLASSQDSYPSRFEILDQTEGLLSLRKCIVGDQMLLENLYRQEHIESQPRTLDQQHPSLQPQI
jgi:hypothetical protein